MTTKDYIKKLDQRIKEVSFANKNIYLCVADAHADYVRRIFVEGKRADGGFIGAYTNEPYKKKRQKKGRQTRYVDLRLEGRLETDLANSLQKRSNFVVVNGVTNRENALKVEGQSERYGKDVFMLGDKIEKSLAECLGASLVKIIAG